MTPIAAARWGALYIQANAVDAALTVAAVSTSLGREANPLMRVLIEQHAGLFVAVKMFAACWVAWMCWRKRSRLIIFGTALTGAVVLYNMAVVTLRALGIA